jgi:hypothetical protein
VVDGLASPFEEIVPLMKILNDREIKVSSPASDFFDLSDKGKNSQALLRRLPPAIVPPLGPAGHWIYFQMKS